MLPSGATGGPLQRSPKRRDPVSSCAVAQPSGEVRKGLALVGIRTCHPAGKDKSSEGDSFIKNRNGEGGKEEKEGEREPLRVRQRRSVASAASSGEWARGSVSWDSRVTGGITRLWEAGTCVRARRPRNPSETRLVADGPSVPQRLSAPGREGTSREPVAVAAWPEQREPRPARSRRRPARSRLRPDARPPGGAAPAPRQ